MPKERPPVEGLPREDDGTAGKSIGGGPRGATKGLSGKGRGGKRVGRRVNDSAATTKDLRTGVHVSSAGQSSTLDEGGLTALPSTFIFTDILSKEHSDIPPPPAITGRDFYATSNIRPKRHHTTSLLHPVSESTNRYGILTVDDTNDFSLETTDSGCQSPSTKLTKRPTSNSLRAKASNEKTTTISSPIVTTGHDVWATPSGV